MTLPKFEYIKAGSIAHACTFLGKCKGRARVMAGGTDLLVKMKEGEIRPDYLVGLKGIPGLDRVAYSKRDGLRIGCLATHKDVISSKHVQQSYKSLAEALESIGTPQIRNLGTVGGNLCNGSPSSDSAPILIALGASVKIAGATVEREIPLERLFRGPGKTALKSGEILKEIVVPGIRPNSFSRYEKLSLRSSADIAAVGAACCLLLNPASGLITDIRIVLGAAAPVPLRARKAEALLKDKAATEKLIEEAALLASQEARPISDLRASAEYRREMVKVMVKRAIKGALAMA